MSNSLSITLPPLHDAQRQIALDGSRFITVAAGRRVGKSRLAAALSLSHALKGEAVWWVAPTYQMAGIGWEDIMSLSMQLPSVEIQRADRRINYPGGGWLQAKSADNEVGLRGRGLNYLVIDEAAFVARTAWENALRPALSDRLGRALLLSTPNGRNWFWEMFNKGATGERDHSSWHFPTSANPYIQPSEIEAARNSLPEAIFSQEYLAEFRDSGGAVFRNVRECATAQLQDGAIYDTMGGAHIPHSYVIGVDWAKSHDWNVFVVFDLTLRACVYVDRTNHIDYTLQRQRLGALWHRFNRCPVIAEINSMGVPIIEELIKEGLPIQPFNTTNASKAKGVQDLSLAFEQQTISIVDPESVEGDNSAYVAMLNELEAYAMERLPSGLYKYGAPGGLHDDTVMGLVMAYQGATFDIGI